MINPLLMKKILNQQRNELSEYYVYNKLAMMENDPANKKVLKEISTDELMHHDYLKTITKKEVSIKKLKVMLYMALARLIGLAFALRLMESREKNTQDLYKAIEKDFEEVGAIRQEEVNHEKILINILNDVRLVYAGSIVLGLSDALVELTGTLAGLSLAFANSMIIATTGIVVGIAASLSMAASGYLSSQETETICAIETGSIPLKSALYTGITYVITVILLVTPYFLFDNVFVAMSLMLVTAILIIASYSFYISIIKAVPFHKRFFEMTSILLIIAAISFGVGYVVKTFFNIYI
ncbi:MAG: VIT1/CCC1 family protein [Smithella sp.]